MDKERASIKLETLDVPILKLIKINSDKQYKDEDRADEERMLDNRFRCCMEVPQRIDEEDGA